MEQFSHDLTVALEETSKSGGVRTGCWGVRRRTRSTGNLPCAPQPTEDSSSSPADARGHHHMGPGGSNDAILSDSDDRQELKLTLNARKACMLGNFESDSLNETTFSPARPNTRRKRKLKRMAVEYETTPSTPGTTTMAGAAAIGSAATFALHTQQQQQQLAAADDAAAALSEAAMPMVSTSGYQAVAGPSTGAASVAAPSFAHLTPSSLASTSPAAAAAFPHQQQLQPGILGQAAFNAASMLKKRSMKYHGGAENFRANLFFCGKRKRSHRDRYYEQHSSSVPRQRDHLLYNGKNSYSEYRSRNRSFSSAGQKPCERIAPLTNSIVSKIEKISQDTRQRDRAGGSGFRFDEAAAAASIPAASIFGSGAGIFGAASAQATGSGSDRIGFNAMGGVAAAAPMQQPPTTFSGLASLHLSTVAANAAAAAAAASNPSTYSTSPRFGAASGLDAPPQANPHSHYKQHHKDQHSHPTRKQQRRTKRHQMKMRLQFDDPNAMDAMAMPEALLSSSSMSSSSDSEAAQRNDTDREGDDELTDWPGNEAMVNFASKNDFKRAKPRGPPGAGRPLPFIRGGDEPLGDDDTLMSADEMFDATEATATVAAAAGLNGLGAAAAAATAAPPNTLNLLSKYSPMADGSGAAGGSGLTQPIAILHGAAGAGLPEAAGSASFGAGSMGGGGAAVREIRAGCRRVRNERPGFAILTSVNEDLSRFLQDVHKEQLRIPDPNGGGEREKLAHLAQLYSLSMHAENGYVILTKTSNTMQSVRIDRSSSIPKRYLSDYKRRCYGGDEDPESSGMAS